MTKVLITGGAGLLGTYIRQCVARRFDVVSFDLKAPDDGSAAIVGSITRLDDLKEACAGCDAVIHVAAAANISAGTPKEIIEANVNGTWNLLEAASLAGVKRVLLCSSDSVLGNTVWPETFWLPHYLPVDEKHEVRPTDPYGLSKLLAEEAGRSYAARGNMEVFSLRPVFILFPSMVGEAKARQADPENYQPGKAGGHVGAGGGLCWHHIDPRDVASAFDLALDCPWHGYESFYLSASETLHFKPTLQIIADRFGRVPDQLDQTLYQDQPFAPLFNTRKAQQLLGWKAAFNHRQKILEMDTTDERP